MIPVPSERIFKPDKYHHAIGCDVPHGATVNCVRFYPRRRVLIEYEGKRTLTMLWCVPKGAK
jgi:hypothetical protein